MLPEFFVKVVDRLIVGRIWQKKKFRCYREGWIRVNYYYYYHFVENAKNDAISLGVCCEHLQQSEWLFTVSVYVLFYVLHVASAKNVSMLYHIQFHRNDYHISVCNKPISSTASQPPVMKNMVKYTCLFALLCVCVCVESGCDLNWMRLKVAAVCKFYIMDSIEF